MAALSGALIVGLRTTDDTQTSLGQSNAEQLVSTYLTKDVQAAATVRTAGTSTCGNQTIVLETTTRTDPLAASNVTVAYALSGTDLVRQVCGPAPSVHTIAHNVTSLSASGANPVSITVATAASPKVGPTRGPFRCGGGRHDRAPRTQQISQQRQVGRAGRGMRDGPRMARNQGGIRGPGTSQRSNTLLKHIRKHEDKNLLEQGFTLIELLVVVAILGILATVAIFAVGNLTTNAKKNACATEASTVETAAEAFNAQAGRYPTIAEMQTDTTVGTVTVGANLKTASDARVGRDAASDRRVLVQLDVGCGCPRLGLHGLSH